MGRGGRGGGGSSSGGSFGGGGGGFRGGGSGFGGSRGGGSRLGGNSGRGGHGGRNTGGYSSGNNWSGGYRRSGPRLFPPFFGWGGGWGRGYGYGYGPYRRRRGCGTGGCVGCASPFLFLIAILMLFNVMFSFFPGNSGRQTMVETVQMTPSTVERKPLEKGLYQPTGYYTDEMGWIKHPQQLEKGLKHFEEKTNIQPYVYITDNVDGETNPDPEAIDEFAHRQYDELFNDEAHLLLVFFENYDLYDYQYSYHTVYGAQAKTVMDKEAEAILFDYLDYYYPQDIDEEEMFSDAFKDTADRIMHVTKSPWPKALGMIAVAVVVTVLFLWWRQQFTPKDDDGKGSGTDNGEPKATIYTRDPNGPLADDQTSGSDGFDDF